MYSKPEWQQCATFQNGSMGFRWQNYTGAYRLVGMDELQTLDAHSMQSAITNTATNQTGGDPSFCNACPCPARVLHYRECHAACHQQQQLLARPDTPCCALDSSLLPEVQKIGRKGIDSKVGVVPAQWATSSRRWTMSPSSACRIHQWTCPWPSAAVGTRCCPFEGHSLGTRDQSRQLSAWPACRTCYLDCLHASVGCVRTSDPHAATDGRGHDLVVLPR